MAEEIEIPSLAKRTVGLDHIRGGNHATFCRTYKAFDLRHEEISVDSSIGLSGVRITITSGGGSKSIIITNDDAETIAVELMRVSGYNRQWHEEEKLRESQKAVSG